MAFNAPNEEKLYFWTFDSAKFSLWRSKCYHIHSNYDIAYNISGAIFKNVKMISDTSEDILNNICNDLLDFILFIKENFDKFRCK